MSDDLLNTTASELRLATLRLFRRLRRARPAGDLSFSHLAVLGALRLHGRLTLTALAEHEQVTGPSMTNIVNSLEESGYVCRVPDDDDRRKVQVEITEAGGEIVAETTRRRDALLAKALTDNGFTDEELATLRAASALMRRITDQ